MAADVHHEPDVNRGTSWMKVFPDVYVYLDEVVPRCLERVLRCLSDRQEKEHLPRRLRHQVRPTAHAEAGSGEAADPQDEGPEEEEGSRTQTGRGDGGQGLKNREC